MARKPTLFPGPSVHGIRVTRLEGVVDRCSARGCSNIATYLVEYMVQTTLGRRPRQVARKMLYCGTHYRRWFRRYDPRVYPERWETIPSWLTD